MLSATEAHRTRSFPSVATDPLVEIEGRLSPAIMRYGGSSDIYEDGDYYPLGAQWDVSPSDVGNLSKQPPALIGGRRFTPADNLQRPAGQPLCDSLPLGELQHPDESGRGMEC